MKSILPIFFAGLVLAACNNEQQTSSADMSEDTSTTGNDTSGMTTTGGEWRSLFDGKTTTGWHSYGKDRPGSAWKVADGVLYLDTAKGSDGKRLEGGDLVTDDEFENYHLKLEWKITPNGNSGIIFGIKEDTVKYKEPWHTGLEMQVLDDKGHPDGKIPKHLAGDLYDLVSSSTKSARPPGEWNTAEVVYNGNKLDLFLNGTKVVSTVVGDENWKEMVSKSKFKIRKDFATFSKGRIALQDHGDMVYYRNIMIKSL